MCRKCQPIIEAQAAEIIDMQREIDLLKDALAARRAIETYRRDRFGLRMPCDETTQPAPLVGKQTA